MNTKTRILSALAAAALAAGMLSACAPASGGPASSASAASGGASAKAPASAVEQGKRTAYPLTVTTYNYAKEPVEETFEKAPQRVLCNEVNSVETMLSLGLADRIICAAGISKDSIRADLQDEFAKIADKVYDTKNAELSKEVAVMKQPDFILGWRSTFSDKMLGDVDYWHQNHVNTYVALNSNKTAPDCTVENEYQDILTIGKIFDVQEKAQALVAQMQAAVGKAEKAAAGKEKQKVLILDFLGEKIWAYDTTMLAGNLVESMGGEIVPTGENVGREDILNANPDVLYVVTYGANAEGHSALKKITEDPAYASLKSVQGKRVYELPLSEIYTSGVRTIDGLNAIGQTLYPGAYQA